MKIFRKFGMAAILFCLPFTTFAWGTNGHRICGQIAYGYLTPKAKAAVDAILGNESMALASNWADFIKSDPNFKYLSSWHYIDFDKPYSQKEMDDFLAKDTDVDAYTKMNFLIAELKKKDLAKDAKLLDLHMLIHIIEDVHQPMHTAHKDDQGGNKFLVNWFGKPTNMHSLWDSELIDFQQMSYTEYAMNINHTAAAQRAEWQKAPISQWLFESNQIAEKIYADTKQNDNLSYKYDFDNRATLNNQLLKGGVRLAGVLNELFGK